ncbi:MAG: hypothetical protein KatS3mg093_315 [Candidatus Parcubacteria bacterium]|nr:MAG: hypothetical protein KatS3mg093_315 [Candidatus Parcubacteria bacterium]
MPRLYSLEKTRNIGIIAHIDASSRQVRTPKKPLGFLRRSLALAPIFLYGKTPVFPTPFPHQSALNIGRF